MKKIILGLLSILLFSPVFADTTQNFFRSFNVTSGGLDYLCYVGSYHSQVGNTTTHRSSSINCGSFNIDHTFNYSFSIFPELSGYTYTLSRNYNTSSFFYFISGAVHYKLSTYNNEILFDKSFPVGSKSVDLSSKTLNIKNLKINSDLGSFLGFNTNLTNNENGGLYGSLYNQYYFTGYNWLYNTGILNSFYSPDISISSVYYNNGNYQFSTIFDDGFSTNSLGKISSFNTIIFDSLIIPLLDYGYNYLTGSKTLLLKFYNGNLIYNLLNCYSNKSRILSGCSIIDKGYFNNYVDLFNGSGFLTIGNLSTYSNKNIFYSYYNNGIIDVYFSPLNVVTRFTNDINSYIGLTKSFNLVSDSSVLDIWSSIKFPLNSGEVVDVLESLCNSSLLKPAFCNGVDQVSTGVDGFWDLDGSGRLIYTLINTDPNNMGWGDITPNGSGGFNIICSDQDGFGCPLLENVGLSGYLDYGSGFILGTDYYETFFQKTGRFFACPYGYVVLDTNSFLKILNKFNQISESIGFDFMLPINCSIAAFTHGKNYKFLKDVDLGLNPLMGHIQGPDDPRVYLYRFFDFLMSIALLFFLLKLYHLIF